MFIKQLSVNTAAAALITLGTVAAATVISFYSITDVGTLGRTQSYAKQINNSDRMIDGSHAVWENGAIATLAELATSSSSADDINNSKQAIAQVENWYALQAFLPRTAKTQHPDSSNNALQSDPQLIVSQDSQSVRALNRRDE
ncbi:MULTISPECIES: hypothetical protein [Cyanophyceae]|uniref:hypothetical protein n=1 Tax=Cyanophyceae TaxID=3028117 RepID=UPI0016851AC0|nr:hypothetical protein [Trichocoleus sp. FACHB-69]MBD1934622.1 hypothetical protein [Trichocoleus sp. FACHB-69]